MYSRREKKAKKRKGGKIRWSEKDVIAFHQGKEEMEMVMAYTTEQT